MSGLWDVCYVLTKATMGLYGSYCHSTENPPVEVKTFCHSIEIYAQSEYEEGKAMVHALQMLAWVANPKE
jgi:hypothetical protein